MTSKERPSNLTKSYKNIQNGEEIFNILREVMTGVSREKNKKKAYETKYQEEPPARQVCASI